MDREELQSRRAYNQIWNGAGRYDLHPEEAAFDDQGDAELYINTIMGLAYGLYDFSRFQPMLHSFQLQQKGGLYTDVFWLGMEHAVFARAGKARPALAGLRREYAQRTLARPHPQDPRESAESLRAAWARRVLAGEGPRTRGCGRCWRPWNLTRVERAENHRSNGGAAVYILSPGPPQRYRPPVGGLRRAEHRRQGRRRPPDLSQRPPGPGTGRPQRKRRGRRRKDHAPAELPPGQNAGAHPAPLCGGLLRYVHAHPLAAGGGGAGAVHGGTPELPAALYQRNAAGASHQCRRRLGCGKLSAAEREKPGVLSEKPSAKPSDNRPAHPKTAEHPAAAAGRGYLPGPRGAAAGDVAWRAAALGEQRIFTRRSDSQPGELSVDILLDGSASQNRQQEKLAAQAYIIVESLSRCRIPVRVTAFCSVSGCTVLRILRDYDKPEEE